MSNGGLTLGRLAASVVVAVFVAVGAAAALSVSADSAGAEPVALPEPAAGDRGMYSAATYRLGPELRAMTEEEPWDGFLWHGASSIHDAAGTPADAVRLEWVHMLPRPSPYYLYMDAESYFLGDDGMVSHEELRYLLSLQKPDIYSSLPPFSRDLEVVKAKQYYNEAPLPCGFGLAASVQASLRDCHWAGEVPHNATVRLEQVRILDGEVAMAYIVEPVYLGENSYGVDDWSSWYRFWFVESVPYPVFVERDPDRSDDLVRIYRLSHFDRSDAPLWSLGGRLDPLPRLESRPGHLPDESGVEMAFHLSEAVEFARLQPDVMKFLLDHPSAYVAWARYSEEVNDGDRHGVWSLGYSTGTVDKKLEIGKPLAPAEAVPYRSPSPREPWGNYHDPLEFFNKRPEIPPQHPDQMPSLASLMELHHARMGETANSWGFTIHCEDDCSHTVVTMHAGAVQFDKRYSPYATGGVQESEYGRLLFVDDDSAMRGIASSQRTSDRAGAGLSASERSMQPPGPPEVQGERSWGSFLRLPSGSEAAAVGALAAAAGILYALWPTLKASLAVLFSRLRDEHILQHPVREQLVTMIQGEPGIHYQELVRRSGRVNSIVTHHLNVLVRVGKVSEVRGSGYKCFFPKGSVDRRIMRVAPVLKSEGAREILSQVQQRPGITAGALAKNVKMGASAITYHAKRLADAGLLERSRDGRRVHLKVTEDGELAVGGKR